jgi:hypothetical protein
VKQLVPYLGFSIAASWLIGGGIYLAGISAIASALIGCGILLTFMFVYVALADFIHNAQLAYNRLIRVEEILEKIEGKVR